MLTLLRPHSDRVFQRYSILVPLVTVWMGCILGQSAPDYSQEPVVVEQFSTQVSFENDGTGERTAKLRVRIQSDAGIQRYAVLTFGYQGSCESLDVQYVRVYKRDATVVLTPPDNVQDLPSEISRQAPFYSDLREKHVAVKGLGVGDILEYQAHWKTAKPLAPGQFWFTYDFAHDGIILNERLEVSVPRERAVKWRSPKFDPTITQTSGRRVFTWTASQLEHKSKEQEKKDQEALVYQAVQGRIPQPEVQISSFQTWEEVGRWYNSLQEERAKPTPETRVKAMELTKSLADDRAKARAIYDYVSTQVHYIGIDLGLGRYQPHPASEVLSNQYGDCKDKHTLFAALLAAAGIQASAVLINSARDLDPDVPAPAQFDHVISAVRLGDKLTWLDTTPEVAPFEFLFSPLRDKKALLVSEGKTSALVTTPAAPLVKSSQTFRIDAKLSDAGVLQGKIERTLQGDDTEVLLRAAFRRVPMPQWKDLIQQLSYASGFAGEVSEVTATSPDKTDQPFQFGYNYERKDYTDWANRRVSSPLPSIVLPALPEKDAKPANPVWLGAPGEILFESRVEVPKGYRPVIPKSLDVDQSFAEYHRSYAFKNGILTTQRRLVVKLREVPIADIDAYKKFSKVLAEEYERTVALSSGHSSRASYQDEIWELPYSENPEAARAYDDAREKYSKNDVQGEIASLRRALSVDPNFVRAWLWLGEIYKFNRQSSEAIEAYNQAIKIDPQQPVSYKALGYTLLVMKKNEDAVSVWQQLIKVAPSDATGPEELGSALVTLKRYREAEPVLEQAAHIDPEDAGVRMLLGIACLHAGDHEKAMSVYQKALELDPSPFMFNNVAYDLAEANQNLTAALEYATRAVKEEGEATRKVKLSELKTEDLGPTRNLSTYWDTLGWVHFKMGHLDQAEKYLNAAWLTSQIPAAADHLGQVYERQEKKSAAVRMYRYALSSSAAQTLYGGDRDMIRQRLERLAPGTADDYRQLIQVTGELSRMRTSKLPSLGNKDANADLFLLIGQDPKTSSWIVGDVKFVKFISGSEMFKSADAALRSFSLKDSLPDDGHPRLLLRGILFCSEQSGCSLTLISPQEVHSVN